MSNKLYFKEWLGKSPAALFGFPSVSKIVQSSKDLYEEEPLEPLKVSNIINELVNLGKVGTRNPKKTFESKVVYGERINPVGNYVVEVSPLGSLKIIIRRQITDLKGESIDICKNIFPLINDYNHIGEHDIEEELRIAVKVNTYLESVDKTPIEKPDPKYTGLKKLVLEMAAETRARHPAVMIYNGVVENNKNNYTIYFSFTGEGVEAPTASRVEQFNINLSYYPESGLIRCWGNDISSPTKQRLWRLQPSEWDEYYSPSQPNKEIIESVRNAFSTY
jgi:hypothetical protein